MLHCSPTSHIGIIGSPWQELLASAAAPKPILTRLSAIQIRPTPFSTAVFFLGTVISPPLSTAVSLGTVISEVLDAIFPTVLYLPSCAGLTGIQAFLSIKILEQQLVPALMQLI